MLLAFYFNNLIIGYLFAIDNKIVQLKYYDMKLLKRINERKYQINRVTIDMDDTKDIEVCESGLTYQEVEERFRNLLGFTPEETIQTPLGSLVRRRFSIGKAYDVMPACPPEKRVYFVIWPVYE